MRWAGCAAARVTHNNFQNRQHLALIKCLEPWHRVSLVLVSPVTSLQSTVTSLISCPYDLTFGRLTS
jgi:hypothetical protein